jgi:hypothetical protein
LKVLRKFLQNVKEDLGSQMMIGDIDNDGSDFHVAVEFNSDKEREIAAGGNGSAYLPD